MRSGSVTWLSVAGPLAQLRPREPGCSGLPSNLRTSQRLAVDVGEQAAGRLAVEAGGRHQHVALLDSLAATPASRARPSRPSAPSAGTRRGGCRLGPGIEASRRASRRLALGRDHVRLVRALAVTPAASCERHRLAGLDVGVLVGEQADAARAGPRPRRCHGRERRRRATSSDAGPEEAARSARASSPARRGGRARWRAARVTSPATSSRWTSAAPAEHPLERADRPRLEPVRERQQRGRAEQDRLHEQVRRQQRALPEVAGLGLREEVARCRRPSAPRAATPAIASHCCAASTPASRQQQVQREHAAVAA